jgi:ATP-dependent Clp protease adaptor protein ClpS
MEGAADEAPAKTSPELQSVLQLAAGHAQSIGRDTINGVDVLLPLLPEPAGHFLQQQGMTRYGTTRFISHGIVGGDADPSGVDPPAGASAEVRMLNDDYTPMEFVVHVLENVFAMDHDPAVRVMLQVHQNGVGTCGTFPSDVARAKVAEVLAAAREHGHPLHCVLVQPAA